MVAKPLFTQNCYKSAFFNNWRFEKLKNRIQISQGLHILQFSIHLS